MASEIGFAPIDENVLTLVCAACVRLLTLGSMVGMPPLVEFAVATLVVVVVTPPPFCAFWSSPRIAPAEPGEASALLMLADADCSVVVPAMPTVAAPLAA